MQALHEGVGYVAAFATGCATGGGVLAVLGRDSDGERCVRQQGLSRSSSRGACQIGIRERAVRQLSNSPAGRSPVGWKRLTTGALRRGNISDRRADRAANGLR